MSTDQEDIRARAALWVIRLNEPEPLRPAERNDFEEWVSHPLHAEEFQAINAIRLMAEDLPTADRTRLSDWARNQIDERAQSGRQVVRWWAIAASLLGVLVLGGLYAQNKGLFGGDTYTTRAGESRTVTFKEGSVAYLNTRTEVRWVGAGHDRRVELAEGEALFDVVHDAENPFRVTLDNSEIRVLGTRFNVYRKPNGDTTVTVLEGTVEVRGLGNGSATPQWVRTLHHNEQIEYRNLGLIREPHPTEAQRAVAWRTGNFRFEDQTVEKVLDELTRYTDQHIVIRDPRAAEYRINGSLDPRDVHKALRALQRFAPIEVTENNKTFTLDYRAKAEPGKD